MRNTNQYSYSDTRHLQAIARAEARAEKAAIQTRSAGAKAFTKAAIFCMAIAACMYIGGTISTGIAQTIINVSRMLVSTANASPECSALIKADPDGPIVACTYKR